MNSSLSEELNISCPDSENKTQQDSNETLSVGTDTKTAHEIDLKSENSILEESGADIGQVESIHNDKGTNPKIETDKTLATEKLIKFSPNVNDVADLQLDQSDHAEQASRIVNDANDEGAVAVKKVKFADEAIEDLPSTTNSTPQPSGNQTQASNENDLANSETINPPEVFEGPAQRVARNSISLLDFEDKREFRLNPQNIKTILLGKQSLLPASRRSNDVKTIFRIGKKTNPYATINEGKIGGYDGKFDELLISAARIDENDPLFDELRKLPRLGVKQDIVEVSEDAEEKESTEIVIKTEAPTGMYLPNGNRKACMITGTEVKYFDPSTGIPYSSVEAYKVLKLIEKGQAQWLSLDNDVNDTGTVDLYLGLRGESARHAKGVPPGFAA